MSSHLQGITRFFQTALESSFHLAPREPGLTYAELLEIGQRGGFQDGEIRDALPQVVVQTFGGGSKRLIPNSTMIQHWAIFPLTQNPEFRNFDAFDFVMSEMNSIIRAMGGLAARIQRDVLVERGVARNIPRLDVEAAITIMVAGEQLVVKDGQIASKFGHVYEPLPSQQRSHMRAPERNELRARAFSIVKDVIERRADGRPSRAEALDEFPCALERLNYAAFRSWWVQMVAELRLSNPNSAPVSTLVLSAALVEGALAFVVKHAQAQELGVLGSRSFTENPRTWKIDDLVLSAAAGRETAILDVASQRRAEWLTVARQRIHAGRMLSAHPGGAPDLRPEEAREAKAVAELVVRRVLDWLERYPPSQVSQDCRRRDLRALPLTQKNQGA